MEEGFKPTCPCVKYLRIVRLFLLQGLMQHTAHANQYVFEVVASKGLLILLFDRICHRVMLGKNDLVVVCRFQSR